MKIYKYLHSCLVFEKEDFKLLVDPGKFSFAEGLVKSAQFSDVQAIIITHNHPDHLDAEILKQIITASNAPVYTNNQVAEEIKEAGIDSRLLKTGENTIGPFKIEAFEVQHETLLDSPTPQMTAFIVDGKVLHPVDSFEENLQRFNGVELLILPTMAPFTTELIIAAFADKLQPKQIFPVHDGFAKDFFIKQRYENYSKHFEKQGIKFHQPMQPGDFIEVD